MFGDVGFWELTLIMVVALLVIGPERLPGLARKAGLLAGKAKRFVQNVKADIDQEMAAEELKKIMKEHQESIALHEIVEETRETIDEAREEYLVKAVSDEKTEEKKNKPSDEIAETTAKNDNKQS
jgi:sec-independent protein translocase protein TatB